MTSIIGRIIANGVDEIHCSNLPIKPLTYDSTVLAVLL